MQGEVLGKHLVRILQTTGMPNLWNGLRYNLFASHFTSTQIYVLFVGISRDDFLSRVIATPDTLIHPYLIEFELCLRDMWHHFLSRTHFWAGIESNPATFTSWRLAVLNENWFIEAVVGEMLFIDLTSFFCTWTDPFPSRQYLLRKKNVIVF